MDFSERAKGASIGATIVGGFGAAWLAIGMTRLGVPLGAGVALVLPVFVLIAFLGAAVRRRLPKAETANPLEKNRIMRQFYIVNAGQWLAIFAVASLLANQHMSGWIVTAIVLIVGAHFIPLAQIFQAPLHMKTGIAMMACAALAVLLPPSARDVVECLSAGVILWASAVFALRAAFRMAPPPRLAAHV